MLKYKKGSEFILFLFIWKDRRKVLSVPLL